MQDLVIIGVLNDNAAENGVFNPRTLGLVKELSEDIALLPGIKAIRDEDVASIATMDNISGTADGLSVDPFMEEVPQTREGLAALKNTLFGNAMYVDWLVSRDGTGLLITAKMESSEGTSEGVARRSAVYRAVREMIEAKRDAGIPEELHVAGRGVIEVTFEEDGQKDLATFMPLVLLVVIGTLFCTYRSLRGVLLPFSVVVIAVIWMFGSMAVFDVPVDIFATVIPVMLMAIGVADGIHILGRYYDELLERPEATASEAVLATMQEMWSPVVFTSLTTAVGFLAFLTASLPPIRYFGLFTAVGVLAAMVLSLTLLPALLVMLPPKVNRRLLEQMKRSGSLAATGWVARALTRLSRGMVRNPLLVWVPTVILVGASVVGLQRLVVDASWIKLFHPQSPIPIADKIFREQFQGPLPLYVSIEGDTPDLIKDPDLLQKLDRLQTEIEQDPAVGGSLSIAEYIKRMNRVMNEDRPDMEVVPTSRELIAQYLLLYSFSGDPDDFDEVVDYDYQHANLIVYLRSDTNLDSLRVVHKVQDFAAREFGAAPTGQQDESTLDPIFLRFGRWLGGIEPTITDWGTNSGFRMGIAGPGQMIARYTEFVVAGMLSSLVISLSAIFLLTTSMFRSLTAGLITVLPISLVMLVSYGLMGLFNIYIDAARAIVAAMGLGIGIDYTIHFLNKYRLKVQAGLTDPEEITVATMATSGKAIFFNAAVVVGGFLVLLSSNFRSNFNFGALLAFIMSACLIASITILPTILNLFKPRFVYGPERAPVIATDGEGAVGVS